MKKTRIRKKYYLVLSPTNKQYGAFNYNPEGRLAAQVLADRLSKEKREKFKIKRG